MEKCRQIYGESNAFNGGESCLSRRAAVLPMCLTPDYSLPPPGQATKVEVSVETDLIYGLQKHVKIPKVIQVLQIPGLPNRELSTGPGT